MRMKRPGNERLSFVERTGMPGLTILGALSQGGCVSNEFKKVSFQQSGRARTSILADLCAPSLLAEEATPLASCTDLTR